MEAPMAVFLTDVGNNSDVYKANITYAEVTQNLLKRAITKIIVWNAESEGKYDIKHNKI